MRVVNHLRTHNLRPAQNTPPVEMSFKDQVLEQASQTADSFARTTGTLTGGIAGVSAVALSLGSGVLGGAAIGAAFGAGPGIMFGAIASDGLLDFIGNAFSNAGTFAKIGMLVGGAAMAAGSYTVFETVGRKAGELPGRGLGYLVGAGKGALDHALGVPAPLPAQEKKVTPSQPVEMPKFFTGIAAGISAAGLFSGLAGGAALGATVAGAGKVIWGSAGPAVWTGALVGAAALGTAGLVGGFQLVDGIRGTISTSKAAQRWFATSSLEGDLTRNGMILEEQEQRLQERVEQFDELQKERQGQLQELQTGITSAEHEIEFTRQERPALVEAHAQERLAQESEALPALRQSNQELSSNLGQRQARYEHDLAHMDQAVERRSQELIAEYRREWSAPIDAAEAELIKRQAELARLKSDPAAAEARVIEQATTSIREDIDEAHQTLEPLREERRRVQHQASQDAEATEQMQGEIQTLERETLILKRKVREARKNLPEAS